MLNILRISEMVGIAPIELLEIEKYSLRLIEHKASFIDSFESWQTEFEMIPKGMQVILDGYYEALVSGTYEDDFYIAQYKQALHWIECDLSQSRVMLILSHFRKSFIQFAEKKQAHNLAKGLCHVLDIGQSIISTVYGIVESIERMKSRSENEVNRIQKSYQLISAEIPPTLLRAYLDHQKWKLVTFNLSLGRPLDWDGFEISHEKCRLANWLNQGGKDFIPAEKLDMFLESHERVHRFGQMAIKEAEGNQPEKILSILGDMQLASDYVSDVLLDVIEAEFIRIATADGLTGLPNRRSFDMDFDQNIAFANRHQFWVGLVLVDIDFFKKVNDAFGHTVGDAVLKNVADILQDQVREEEKAYRWGGEEFSLVTLDKKPGGAEALAERIRQAVEKNVFLDGDAKPLKLTVSCGSVCFSAQCTLPKHEIFALVDKQLYAAKEAGRNQVQHKLI